jgi:putative ABC transport system ATP-binding protein
MKEAEIFRTIDLCRHFKSGQELVRVLDYLNIRIADRTLTMLKGRSGSGKTTLINLLGALDYPTAGRVLFRGQDLTALSEKHRDELRRFQMGFVFQSIALISSMTAYENVEFGLRVAGTPVRQRRLRVEEALEMVGMEKRMRHLTHELSGGEQQRVAIARAIAHKPSVIFADEPTAELDTVNGLKVVNLFRSLVRTEGLTVIMTTHDPNLVELSDQVISLDDILVAGV